MIDRIAAVFIQSGESTAELREGQQRLGDGRAAVARTIQLPYPPRVRGLHAKKRLAIRGKDSIQLGDVSAVGAGGRSARGANG